MIDLDELRFDNKGLIPAIVVDAVSKDVLTLAYMNRQSLEISIAEGRTCFWSRSRRELWRKGETSGNIQKIVSITTDCDKDALTVEVIKRGPACHLRNNSCFSFPIYEKEEEPDANSEITGEVDRFSAEGLYDLLKGRQHELPEGSYTTYLFQKGRDKILKKVGEEATEVIIAGKADDKAETIYELADLMYHAMVLMVDMGITVEEVKTELNSRHVIDYKTKQEKMTSK